MTSLEELPARVDALGSQILQLREEMLAQFSALQGEVRTGDAGVIQTLREEIRAGDEQVIRTLREEIQSGDERILAQVRTLHEDLVSRLALMQEGRRPGRPRM